MLPAESFVTQYLLYIYVKYQIQLHVFQNEDMLNH